MDIDHIIDAITTPENLDWAWQKVLKYYQADAAWRNDIEIATFEINLKEELTCLADELRSHKYKITPLRPIPQPKKADENGEFRVRQLFWIAVKDQVAWVAVVNVIGPILDNKMPKWSFGNRLHRSSWYENEDGKKSLKIGPYRHSTGLLYRKFSQGWPLYRRYIHLTVQKLTRTVENNLNVELEDIDSSLLESESGLDPTRKLEYLKDDYWPSLSGEVYWASIDFAKFYPQLKLDLIKKVLTEKLFLGSNTQLKTLIDGLFDFPFDRSELQQEDLSEIGINHNQDKVTNLPTGLFVAGFLANVAMLDIDEKVTQDSKKYQIAHFRYVDDHIILATKFENLLKWLKHYIAIITASEIAQINLDKTIPEELSALLKSDLVDITPEIKKACWIDPIYPKPLMTKTLNRVSQLALVDFEFLDDNEQESTLNDLELLLLADINDSELPETTRISFAATLISRFSIFAADSSSNTYLLSELTRQINQIKRDIAKSSNNESQLLNGSYEKESNQIALESLLKELSKKLKSKKKEFDLKSNAKIARSYNLLLKAIHKNPEKLRLWQRAIDFCLKTGFSGIPILQNELDSVYAKSLLTGLYIQSLIYSYLSRAIVTALSDLEDKELLKEGREQLFSFIEGAIYSLSRWKEPLFQPYYYQHSFNLLLVTIEKAIDLVTFLHISRGAKSVARASVLKRRYKREFQYFQNRQNRELTSQEYLPLWIWWADSISSPNHRVKPSDIWSSCSDELNISIKNSWHVWQLYPKYLPRTAREAILNGTKNLPEDFDGWLIDAMSESQLYLFESNTILSSKVFHFLNNLNSETSISVYKWASWMSVEELKPFFDPRLSEWTSLEIIRQVINILIDTKIADSFKVHPANIYLPISWIKLNDSCQLTANKVPTWESWKKLITESKVMVAKEEDLISDFRYNTDETDEWLKIKALSMILLGLLKKDFSWPSSWNIHYRSPTIINSQKTIIGRINCSSLTSAILESTLLAKSRESSLIALLQSEVLKDSDTTFDPPRINSLLDLYDCIVASQKTLEKYQFSVSGHKPIQLVPMNIEQLDRFSTPLNNDNEATNGFE